MRKRKKKGGGGEYLRRRGEELSVKNQFGKMLDIFTWAQTTPRGNEHHTKELNKSEDFVSIWIYLLQWILIVNILPAVLTFSNAG